MSASQTQTPVAVIGGGFSGTFTAIHLALRLPDRPVILFEESPEAGPGLAYRRDDAHAVLNIPARRMSAYQDEPDHFFKFARRVLGEQITPDDFLPRRIYGDYIKHCLEEARKNCSNLRVDHRAVIDVQTNPGSSVAVLTLKDQTALMCSRVVLATGNQGSAFSSSLWAQHTLPARKTSTFDQVKPGETVLVIGTGLTMIDAVLELERRGTPAAIHAISRNGLLPRPYQAASRVAPPELDELPDSDLPRSLRLFRQAVTRHTSEGGDWRDVFAALRPATPSLWQEMSSRDRRKFLRFISPFWEVHRHQCAPETFHKFQTLIDEGKLDLKRGTIVSVENRDGRLRLGLAPRNRAAVTRWLDADHIIDATGPARDITTIQHPLITNLLRRGFLVPDEFRLGAEIHHDYRAVSRDGFPLEWLYVTGPMLRARYFEATAVPELRLHTAALATRLASELEKTARVPAGV
ncbi:FAD/NAD(P)-binding protein [Luteolibacter flavescens]|uniref:FAD/NAD(P)-binding protein n=1 Tax=Luteolibacter flavescens TaxID=1859460 RepID=A0ABT3FV08_9BACT|nr:FAD/NAD(P)-binding protein [Luteolibacter flavescens]MCW1887129.1 FAD/NAD(P)-binding protein [Luteolibacter flavescens]